MDVSTDLEIFVFKTAHGRMRPDHFYYIICGGGKRVVPTLVYIHTDTDLTLVSHIMERGNNGLL